MVQRRIGSATLATSMYLLIRDDPKDQCELEDPERSPSAAVSGHSNCRLRRWTKRLPRRRVHRRERRRSRGKAAKAASEKKLSDAWTPAWLCFAVGT